MVGIRRSATLIRKSLNLDGQGGEGGDTLNAGPGNDELCPAPASTTSPAAEVVDGNDHNDTLAPGSWTGIGGTMGYGIDTCPTATTLTECNVGGAGACSWP